MVNYIFDDIYTEIRHSCFMIFFRNGALEMSAGISDDGQLPWHLVVSLLAAWAFTFLLIFPGKHLILLSNCNWQSGILVTLDLMAVE